MLQPGLHCTSSLGCLLRRDPTIPAMSGARFRPGGSDQSNADVYWVSPRDFCVSICERYGPTLQRRICVRALASGLIVWRHRVQNHVHLDRGSSPMMTSARSDAGIGVRGRLPVHRRSPGRQRSNVGIFRSASPSAGWPESVVLVSADSTNNADESATHSMKEKQQ